MLGSTMRYAGHVAAPVPPCPAGFVPVEWTDPAARARSEQIARASVRVESGQPATLGDPPDDDALAAWTYRDELLATGLYRFFVYEHPNGRAIGAMRFAGTLGAIPESMPNRQLVHGNVPLQFPNRGIISENLIHKGQHRSLGAPPATLGDFTDSGLQNAALAVMTLFQSTPPDQNAHPEISAFQTAYNAQAPSVNQPTIQVDGEYGPCTQVALQNVLNAAVPAGGQGPTQTAPNTTFPGQCQNGTYVAPPGVANTQPTTTAPAATTPVAAASVAPSSGSSGTLWLVLGGLVVVGAGVAGIAAGHGKWW
jgi:hypothetical protein